VAPSSSNLSSCKATSALVTSTPSIGAAVGLINDERMAALMMASHNGHTGAVRVLLEVGAEIGCKDKNGWAALMCAARFGHEGVMQALLEAGYVCVCSVWVLSVALPSGGEPTC